MNFIEKLSKKNGKKWIIIPKLMFLRGNLAATEWSYGVFPLRSKFDSKVYGFIRVSSLAPQETSQEDECLNRTWKLRERGPTLNSRVVPGSRTLNRRQQVNVSETRGAWCFSNNCCCSPATFNKPGMEDAGVRSNRSFPLAISSG